MSTEQKEGKFALYNAEVLEVLQGNATIFLIDLQELRWQI
jgi:hypothetical protein